MSKYYPWLRDVIYLCPMTWPFQDYTYEYEDDDNLLSTFSVDLFADEEVRDALRLNGDVKRIHKIRWPTWLVHYYG